MLTWAGLVQGRPSEARGSDESGGEALGRAVGGGTDRRYRKLTLILTFTPVIHGVLPSDSFWKSRYLEQKGINKQLEQQVAQLEKDTAQLARKEAAGTRAHTHAVYN